MTAYFSGTSFSWIAKRSDVYGIARVTLDGKAPVDVDLYNATAVFGKPVWSSGTLASGYHRVKIEWTGKKRAASKGTNINVDAFLVTGSLTGGPARYEQTRRQALVHRLVGRLPPPPRPPAATSPTRTRPAPR